MMAPDMGVSMVGLIVVLLLAGLIIAGIVLLFVFLGRKAWWVVGIGGLVLAMAAVALMWVSVRVESPRSRAMELAERAALQARKAELAHDRAVAVAGPEESPFLADVYPSAEQAALAVAGKVSGSVASVAPEVGPQAPSVLVTGQAPAALLERVAGVLRQRALVGEIRVATSAESSSRPASPEGVTCGVRADPGDEGVVQIHLSGLRGTVTESAQFLAKPWAANFARYASDAPERRILAKSPPSCPSFAEAERAALADAAGQLLPLVSQAVRRGVSEGRFEPRARALPPETPGRIEAELLRGGRLVVDRFPQRFDRPYGQVWRQSLLVNASPETVDSLADSVVRQAVGERSARLKTWGTLAGSVVGLIALILVAYVVLNAATKGYYVWVLRLAAGALVAGGAAVLLMLA